MAFKNVKILTNAAGKDIIEVKKTTVTGEPGSITQVVNVKGGIDRNYYNENGQQTNQVSNNDHGHKKESGLGKHGEHVHDYWWNEKKNRIIFRPEN